MALRVIEARAYARAKQIVEQAKKDEDIPDSPMIDMVWEIQRDIMHEVRSKRGR